MSWQHALQDYVDFLKEKHQLTDREILQALSSQRIPAEAFASSHTPLQAAATWLAQRGKTVPEIARVLGRTPAETQRFLTGDKLPAEGTHHVPVEIFADRELSASEHLVEELERQGLSVREIATLLDKSPRTIYTLHYRIREKRGDGGGRRG